MDLGRIISRSLEITGRYRALWLFGILLAIFGGGSGSVSNTLSFRGSVPRGQNVPSGGAPPLPSLPPAATNTIIMIVAVVICIILILAILSIILRLVSRGAVIGLVQELEANQTRPSVRRGFNIGFERFRSLLGIALWVNVPLFVISVLFLILAGIPLLAALIPLIRAGRAPEQMAGPAIAGVLSSLVLLCCVVIFLWIVELVIQPFYQFFVRACVIGRRGALDSIREGYRLVRANLGNVILLYLILVGLGIVYLFVVGVLALILFAIGVVIGLVVGLLSQSATPGIIVAVILAIPVLLLLLFVEGFYQVFDSTMWTEGYMALASPAASAVQETPAATN